MMRTALKIAAPATIVLLAAMVLTLCPHFVPAAAAQASGLENGPAPPPDEPDSSAPAREAAPTDTPAEPVNATRPPAAPAPDEPAASPPAEAAPAPAPADRPSLAKRAGTAEPAKPAAAEPEAPAWDPLHASKSVEVGVFYMRKGDLDAAIDRFQDAARMQPGLAKPFFLLGEVYERKDQPADAVAAYRKYLELYPTAPDSDKIRKRIERLEGRIQRESARRLPPGG
jgi:tetratricopeptide (TPR) repeat protein